MISQCMETALFISRKSTLVADMPYPLGVELGWLVGIFTGTRRMLRTGCQFQLLHQNQKLKPHNGALFILLLESDQLDLEAAIAPVHHPALAHYRQRLAPLAL